MQRGSTGTWQTIGAGGETVRAFIPAPLPPDPPLDLSGPLRDKLSQADYALGLLDGAVLTLPDPDLFVFMYMRKEGVLSNQGIGLLREITGDARNRRFRFEPCFRLFEETAEWNNRREQDGM
ncbi:hypothetical protein Tsedi_00114 [Tepidimonas sediminis]|uniref:Fic/DOC N-terminal domain-containing protein n=1 Tax=Tepidimonas sediminis TaxID=2588941 RepID=A0A554WUP1_9BURK|nr:Fic/DOC family N-terminal domain-containing protein [Tepidimonas sediminis]TSE27284.1 hypothetical protein Tsedi_00114 [Tepidimonas sediminis]